MKTPDIREGCSRRVFLDFEASSLSKASYPIEVGWVFETGEGEAHLIRPAPVWTDWDTRAQAIHGIAREALVSDGESHELVAARMVDQLSAHTVYASAPSWDGKWMSLLLRAAGFPRHAIRLHDTDEAQAEIAQESGAGPAEAAQIIAEARRRMTASRPAHRALQDAEQERRIWLQVRNLARAQAKTAGAS